MSEETTQNMPDADERSFEERVFARFDALDNALTTGLRELDARLQKLEARAYDTKPIWEQALKEIIGYAPVKRALICERPKTVLKSLSPSLCSKRSR